MALLFFATSLWHIYVVLAALSCVSSFFGPAQSVTIRSHVPPDGLLSANALMQLAMMGVRVIGPAAAGVLVAAFGATICYSLDVVSFLGSAALIGSVAIIRAPDAPADGVGEQPCSRRVPRHERGYALHFSSRGALLRRHGDGSRPVHDWLLRAAHRRLRA